jgi:chromosome segregation ATPase
MSREGAEYALRARADERDRISGDLLDLESHTTYQLLKGASLRGATERRWAAAHESLATLWSLNDAYRAVLRDAEQIRASRAKLGTEQLAELTGLLDGASVVLRAAAKPVEQRSLLPQSDERLTLDQTVTRMDAAFRDVTSTLNDIDAVWNAVLPRLDDADSDLRRIRDLERELGEDAGLADRETELRRIRVSMLEDPLGTAVGQDLDRLVRLLSASRAELDLAITVKNEYARRREDLVATLDQVRGAESEARLAHGAVVVKIALPPQAQPRGRAEALAGELDGLDASADTWVIRAKRLAALEGDARKAADQAQATAKALYGLVGRRDELRGRLGACQVMAVRKGMAEDPAVSELFERARALLWSAPCDLTKAAAAVDTYQRAIHGGKR